MSINFHSNDVLCSFVGKMFFPLHHKAKPHTARVKDEKKLEFFWAILPKPPYSSIFVLSDFTITAKCFVINLPNEKKSEILSKKISHQNLRNCTGMILKCFPISLSSNNVCIYNWMKYNVIYFWKNKCDKQIGNIPW